MTHKELKKYLQKEVQRDVEERKTIAQKYKRYNGFMLLMSFFISFSVILIFILLFDDQVLKPQDERTNEYFTEKTAVVSLELARLFTCEPEMMETLAYYDEMADRLGKYDILMVVHSRTQGLQYASDEFYKEDYGRNIRVTIDQFREGYVIENHKIPYEDYEIFFMIPKSDGAMMRRTFLIYIAAIFFVATVFRSGFSHTIMKRVYKNMVAPLEKLKQGTHQIRSGNYDQPICPEIYYNRELKDTFRGFELMRLQLKENKKLSSQYEANRKELISNISHDLKTPIASIIGYVEGLLDGVANTPAKKDRYMQIIYKKSLDMNRLINDLILFSKLDVNKLAFDFERTNFQTYMEGLFEDYGIEMQENGVQLVSRYQCKDNLNVFMDAKQMRRVFNNIIGNAMKHLNKDTKAIEIVVYEDQQDVVVRISDNGMGIPEDKVDQIFDRFYKGDASRNTEIGSSGLGLSISKQIVQAHGGRIWATSKMDEGTIIYFTLSKKERQNG